MLNSWQFFAVCSALFAGLTALFGKIGVEGIHSNLATFIRTGVILIVTGLILSLSSQWQRLEAIGSRTWFFLVLSGITAALSWLCYYRALQIGPLAKVASIDKLSIAVAVVLGALCLGERLSWQAALGAGLIMAGSLLIAAFG